MALFINSEEFKQLNVGFALDEGIAHPEDLFFIFNGERSIWRKLYTKKKINSVVFVGAYYKTAIL